MKILFVCLQYIHAARWINQLKESGHEIYVFDCLDKSINQDLLWTNYITNWSKRKLPKIKGEYFLEKKVPKLFEKIEPFLKITASEKLNEIIKVIQPDLVHTLEMQSQTYPLLKVRKKNNFKWAYSCWGNDIYYYKNLALHKNKIIGCINGIDFFFLECERDRKLIKSINSKANVLGTKFPGGGGYYIENYIKYIKNINDRNLIIIKGYQHTFGRSLRVLEALELIIDKIRDYKIYVYSAHTIVIEKIKFLNKKHNINIKYSSRNNELTHIELLKKFGQAKIAIGNNISDGIPNTLIEAMILGAFPIQSNPGGVSEDYIEQGINGLLINKPEDPKEIAIKVITSLTDTPLIARAFDINQKIAKKLEFKVVKNRVLEAYSKIQEEI